MVGWLNHHHNCTRVLYNDVMRSLNLKVWYVYVGSLPQAPGDVFVAALIYCDMYYSLYVDHVNLTARAP